MQYYFLKGLNYERLENDIYLLELQLPFTEMDGKMSFVLKMEYFR